MLAVAALVAGCSTPAPKASNAVPPPASAVADPLVWVSLGGSEAVGRGGDRAGGSWSQVVLGRLPESSQLVNVATPGARVADAATQLLAVQASPDRPTVASVWFGAGDQSTPSSAYRGALGELIDALRRQGVDRVVVITRTDQGVGARADDNRQVATEKGVPLVALDLPRGEPGSAALQTAIADQVAPALG